MLELSLPIFLAGQGLEVTTWAGITEQWGQPLSILNHPLTKNPFSSSLRNSSSQLPFVFFRHQGSAGLVQKFYFHRNDSRTWKIQPLLTMAASEKSRRNPGAEEATEKSLTKRLFHRNIHPPQTLGGCCLHPDTAFYICPLSDLIPRSSLLNLGFLLPKRHPSQHRTGEKKTLKLLKWSSPGKGFFFMVLLSCTAWFLWCPVRSGDKVGQRVSGNLFLSH